MNYINNQPVKRDWVNRTKRILDKAAPYIVATLAIVCGYVLPALRTRTNNWRG